MLVQKSLRISNDLYGKEDASAYELANVLIKTFIGNVPSKIPNVVRKSNENLKARRKLTLILILKTVENQEFEPEI